MPAGRTHDRITLWSLPLVGGAALAISRSSSITLTLCAGFLLGGLLFGPDLDIHSVHYRRWGWLRWIWLPYRRSVKHRSPLSHAPITGTVVRIIYVLLWLVLFGAIALEALNYFGQFGWTWAYIWSVLEPPLRRYFPELIGFCVGLELGALSHYAADGMATLRKRFRRKGWKALKPPPLFVQKKPRKRKGKRRS